MDLCGYVSYNTWTRICFSWWCFGTLFPQDTSQCYVAKRDISDIRLNQDCIHYLEIHCSQEQECFIRIHNFFVEICLYSFRQRCSLNASATKIQDKSHRMKPLPFIILPGECTQQGVALCIGWGLAYVCWVDVVLWSTMTHNTVREVYSHFNRGRVRRTGPTYMTSSKYVDLVALFTRGYTSHVAIFV